MTVAEPELREEGWMHDIMSPLSLHQTILSWEEGEKCLALFWEDGVYSRAKVRLVKNWKKTAVVRYSYDGTEEEVELSNMKKIPILGHPPTACCPCGF